MPHPITRASLTIDMHPTGPEAAARLETTIISSSCMQQGGVFNCRLRQYCNIYRFVGNVQSEQPLELPPGTHHIRLKVAADGARELTNLTIYTMVISTGSHNNQLACFGQDTLLLSRALWDFRQNFAFRLLNRMATVTKVDH